VQRLQPSEVNAEADEGPEAASLPTYAPGRKVLGAHAVLMGTFLVTFSGSLIAARRAGKQLPEHLGVWDAVTAGMATHKLARLIAKDKVTSFVRAPFVRSQERSGRGEVSSEPRGRGLQFAIGELLTCPYCLGQWVSAALGVGMVAAPRLTRLVTFIYTAETIADFLQLGYVAAEERASTD
jgi:uncharacterized protein DUF1360